MDNGENERNVLLLIFGLLGATDAACMALLDASSHLYKRVCPSVRMSRFCEKCMKLKVLCTEMILKAYKVMNNIKTAL